MKINLTYNSINILLGAIAFGFFMHSIWAGIFMIFALAIVDTHNKS